MLEAHTKKWARERMGAKREIEIHSEKRAERERGGEREVEVEGQEEARQSEKRTEKKPD